jgi:hypothetical protein
MRHRIGLVVGLLLAVVVGCKQEPARRPTVQVTGELYCDGEPAAGAMIFFIPTAGPDPLVPVNPTAQVREDGTFTIRTYTSSDGAPEGEYRLAIVWEELTDNPDEQLGGGKSKIPARYNDPNTSELRVTITKGQPVLERINITRH